MIWHHLNLPEITSDLLISKKITSDLRSSTHNTWDSLRSPGIKRCCQRSPEICCDHLKSRKNNSVQLTSAQIIWYLRILPDMTWHHLRSPQIFWNHWKCPQIFTVQFKILGRAWDHLGLPDIVPDHLRSAEITWDHLRSPQFSWDHLRSSDTCLYCPTWFEITSTYLRSPQIFWYQRK